MLGDGEGYEKIKQCRVWEKMGRTGEALEAPRNIRFDVREVVKRVGMNAGT